MQKSTKKTRSEKDKEHTPSISEFLLSLYKGQTKGMGGEGEGELYAIMYGLVWCAKKSSKKGKWRERRRPSSHTPKRGKKKGEKVRLRRRKAYHLEKQRKQMRGRVSFVKRGKVEEEREKRAIKKEKRIAAKWCQSGQKRYFSCFSTPVYPVSRFSRLISFCFNFPIFHFLSAFYPLAVMTCPKGFFFFFDI